MRHLSTRRTHKLKPPHRRPGKALTLQQVEVFRISGMSAHKGSKFDSPRHRPPLSHRKHPWHTFLLEADSTLGMLGRVGHRAARMIKYVESQLHYSISKPRPSGLYRSISTTCNTAYPHISIIVYNLLLLL